MPEFRRLGGPRGRDQVFNHRHSSLRSVIERCFGILKKKFEILKHMPAYEPAKQGDIVIAAVCLHNFIRIEQGAIDDEFRMFEMDEEYEDTHGRGLAPATADPTRRDRQMGDSRDMHAFREYLADQIYAQHVRDMEHENIVNLRFAGD